MNTPLISTAEWCSFKVLRLKPGCHNGKRLARKWGENEETERERGNGGRMRNWVRELGNGDRMRKWREIGEMERERKWREIQ